jgi:hypothetical protein
MAPGVVDPDSSPRAFCRAGCQSWSLDSRQTRYSYVTVGATTGLSGEIMGVKPPRQIKTSMTSSLFCSHIYRATRHMKE